MRFVFEAEAEKTVRGGVTVAVETALEGGEAGIRSQGRQVGPLPGGRVADDEQPSTLPDHQEAIQRMHQVTHYYFCIRRLGKVAQVLRDDDGIIISIKRLYCAEGLIKECLVSTKKIIPDP